MRPTSMGGGDVVILLIRRLVKRLKQRRQGR
jgi:hypothetical protein